MAGRGGGLEAGWFAHPAEHAYCIEGLLENRADARRNEDPMKLSNTMENEVRGRLGRLRAQTPAEADACWCPLCRADMTALALSSLPPRYATRRARSLEIEPQTAMAVHDGVLRARRQVHERPKHARGAAVEPTEPVWVVNFPLEEGFRAVGMILRSRDGVCDCWHCRCDMVAFALNRYPARYGVEHAGQTHWYDLDRERMRDELCAYLELAVRLVTTVPRHDPRLAAG
jgi:hypothetical protein